MHDAINYKKKYKTLKKKLKFIVYEQECFLEELRKAQRRLLKVSRDRTFLLDRLLQYEKIDDLSSDSDATMSSDNEGDPPARENMQKKKKPMLSSMVSGTSQPASSSTVAPVSAVTPGSSGTSSNLLSNMSFSAMLAQQAATGPSHTQNMQPVSSKPLPGAPVSVSTPVKRAKVTKKTTLPKGAQAKVTPGQATIIRSVSGVTSAAVTMAAGHVATGHMTREELERHLEQKSSAKPTFMKLEQTPNSLPDDIFMQ